MSKKFKSTISKISFIAAIAALVTTADAQTWSTYAGTVKDPVIIFNQFGNGWNITIQGTKATYYLPNFKCPACPVCPPVVVCPPPIDVTATPEFLSLRQTLAQTIDERDSYRLNLERNIIELEALKANYARAIQVLKEMKAERAKYREATILILKDSL